MITLTMLIIIGTIIYLVWNHFEVQKKITEISETNNEFNGKVTEKFINLENDLFKLNDWKDWTDGKTFSLENHSEILNKNLNDTAKYLVNLEKKANRIDKDIKQLRENIDKDVIELNTEIQKIKKSKQRIKVSDLDNLVQRVEKLELEIAAPAFNSYKIFIDEVENHKSKIRTSKGRVSLNKELIVNMIKDGKLSVDGVYSYSQLQTALMEFLQCKKNSTNSKIQRLTNKGLFKKIYSEMGTLYEVNI